MSVDFNHPSDDRMVDVPACGAVDRVYFSSLSTQHYCNFALCV